MCSLRAQVSNPNEGSPSLRLKEISKLMRMAESSVEAALTCYLNAHCTARGDKQLRLHIEQKIGELVPLMSVEAVADALSAWPQSQTALQRFFALKAGLEETLAIRQAARQACQQW